MAGIRKQQGALTGGEGSGLSAGGGKALLVAGVLVIALNLRPSMAAVGPVAGMIREAMGLSSSVVGLLTTLPLIAFGTVSMATPLFTRRYGMAATMAGAMALLAAGIGMRSAPGPWALMGGTLVLGIGIALANVLMPGLVKAQFPRRYGLMTSLYSSMMSVGASVAAGISVPLAATALGWRGSLATWALLALVALVLWLPQLARLRGRGEGRDFGEAMRHLGRSRLAWNVALYMGLQSVTFYVFLAWLPDMVQARGASAAYAGWMLSLSQITGAVGSLLIPLWAGRIPDQRIIVRVVVALELLALAGLTFPAFGPVAPWVFLLGLTLGGAFSLSLFLIGARAADAATATELSGMVQSVGYLVAAIGPFLAGGLYDLGGRWMSVFGLLAAIALVKLRTGTGAGRAGLVSPP